MIEGPKEPQEEKNLRGDKQNYSIAYVYLYTFSMVALIGAFSDYVSSSLNYCKYKG